MIIMTIVKKVLPVSHIAISVDRSEMRHIMMPIRLKLKKKAGYIMKKTKKSENSNLKKITKEERTVTLPKMTSPSEFASTNNFKPLSDKELEKGKYKVKIAGTKDPIPWDEVYSQIRIGIPYEDIQHEFGEIRKIIMFAIEDNIEYIPAVGQLLDDDVALAEKKTSLAMVDPTLVKTLEESVNRYAPNLKKNVAVVLDLAVNKSAEILKADYSTSNDVVNITKALQTVTDIAGLTHRHAAAANINVSNQMLGGSEFIVEINTPPEDIIEVEPNED